MQLTNEMAYLIGALRDGTVTRYQSKNQNNYHSYVAVYNKNLIWIKYVQKIFDNLFLGKSKITRTKNGIYYVRRYSKQIVSMFEKEFQHPIGKQINWRTPSALLNSNDREIWRNYIGGFFDAEGGTIPERQIIFYLSWNGNTCPVLEDIKFKLKILFNIDSGRVSGRENTNGIYPRFCLRIYKKENRKLFIDNIKIYNPSKIQRLVGSR